MWGLELRSFSGQPPNLTCSIALSYMVKESWENIQSFSFHRPYIPSDRYGLVAQTLLWKSFQGTGDGYVYGN